MIIIYLHSYNYVKSTTNTMNDHISIELNVIINPSVMQLLMSNFIHFIRGKLIIVIETLYDLISQTHRWYNQYLNFTNFLSDIWFQLYNKTVQIQLKFCIEFLHHFLVWLCNLLCIWTNHLNPIVGPSDLKTGISTPWEWVFISLLIKLHSLLMSFGILLWPFSFDYQRKPLLN